MVRRSPLYHAPFQNLPLDILYPILSQLTDRKDWHSCTLVSKTFCRVATPFLYRTLDSRIISKTWVHHPSTTLLRRPDLALYVRHVTETGGIHRGMLARNPNITADTLAALSLCTNLRSMTWIDDSSSNDATLLAFLDVLRTLPVRELTIRTHSDLSETVWTQLVSLTGLRKVSIWCMEGPPRVLQGGQWSGPLGNTLTHLELGVSAFLYPCSELLAQLPLLKDLRLKGAPATSIPTILTYLPNLQSLDTEYLLFGSGFHQSKYPRAQHHHDEDVIQLGGAYSGLATGTRRGHINYNHGRDTLEEVNTGIRRNGGTTSSPNSPISPNTMSHRQYYLHHHHQQQQPPQNPLQSHHHHKHQDQDDEEQTEQQQQYEPVQHPPPALKHLTVRTRTLDSLGGPGPQKLWDWVRELVPQPGLETFKLHAFVYSTLPHSSSYSSSSSFSSASSGNAAIPRQFILDLAHAHAQTMKHFMVGDVYVSLEDVQCLAEMFPKLETLVCSTASPNVASIVHAISGARNLQTLKLQVEWLPDPDRTKSPSNRKRRRSVQMISSAAMHDDTRAWGGREDEPGDRERDRDDDDDGRNNEAPEARDRDSATTATFGAAHRGCGYSGDRAFGTLTSGSVSSSSSGSSGNHYYHYQHQQQQQRYQQQQQRSSHAASTTPSSWISPYHYNACFAAPSAPPPQQQHQQGLVHPVQLPKRSHGHSAVVTTVPMTHPYRYDESRFTLEDAMRMMLRTDDSKLRNISVNHMQYTGKWVLQEPEELGYGHADPNWTTVDEKLKFVVTAVVAEDKWRT